MRPANSAARTVTVVGGGVIGLTCAYRLAEVAGLQVTVIAADDPADTVSAVAGAIWFPYQVAPLDDALAWAAAGFREFSEYARRRVPGVTMERGIHYERRPDPDTRWMDLVPDVAFVPNPPEPFTAAMTATLPVIDMRLYLPWLEDWVTKYGVEIVRERVTDLAALPDGPIVLAAGLASGPLVGDDTGYPLRGQVIRVDRATLPDLGWVADDDHPDGPLYVIPRQNDVVIGGTVDRGEADLTVNPETEAKILARATELVPALADGVIVSRGVGLRPGRPSLRVERTDIAAGNGTRPVYCCYGFGGAGVTLSHGAAERICELVMNDLFAHLPSRADIVAAVAEALPVTVEVRDAWDEQRSWNDARIVRLNRSDEPSKHGGLVSLKRRREEIDLPGHKLQDEESVYPPYATSWGPLGARYYAHQGLGSADRTTYWASHCHARNWEAALVFHDDSQRLTRTDVERVLDALIDLGNASDIQR